jgi:Protein of unknown function (DUF2844)
MKFRIPRNRVTVNGIGALLVALLLILISPFPARAALGDNAASVLTDKAHMNGTLHSTDLKTYVMHEITAPGTVLREYVSPAGIVFGVSWEGQFPPDLQQILGPYYEQAKQAAAQEQRPRRAPIAIDNLAWCSGKVAIREVFMA